MKRIILRTVVYFIVLWILSIIFPGIRGDILYLALGAFVLALANTLLRPILNALALPINIVTLGIASVFVNILTIYIADRIVNQIDLGGFWLYLITAIAIMFSDTLIRSKRADRYIRS